VSFIISIAIALLLLFPTPTLCQAPPSSTAPTSQQDPTQIDLEWQKACAKYDAARASTLKHVDQLSHDGPFRPDWESLRAYEVPE